MNNKLLKGGLLLVALCTLMSMTATAQDFVRYITVRDLGTKTLYADSVLTSITLPEGVFRPDDNPAFQKAAAELVDVLKDPDKKLLRIYVCGSTSPEGLWQDNVNLSKARTDAAVRYLRYATGVPSEMIHSKSLDEDWNRLYELIESSEIQYKDEVLEIIRTKTWGERKSALQQLGGGKVWKVLLNDYFPQLRCIRIAIYCQWDPTKPYLTKPKPVAVDEPAVEVVEEPAVVAEEPQKKVAPQSNLIPVNKVPEKSKSDTIYIRDTVYYFKETVYIPKYVHKEQYDYESIRPGKVRAVRQAKLYDTPWMMGFKTNLVSDAMAIPSIGAEIQLGKALSLDLQGFFSGYNIFNPADKNYNVYGFSPELRWWPSGNAMRGGQFLGLHARCAWYTLQWKDGLLYQNGPKDVWEGNYHNAGNSTPAWSAGMTYGYSLAFGRKDDFALEFLIGIGYAKYRQNTAVYNGGLWELVEHQDINHFGITRIGVNFTYRFSLRKVKPDYYEKN